MSKDTPEKRKRINMEWLRTFFRAEAAHIMYVLFCRSKAWKEHNTKANIDVKFKGDSMLKESGKIWLNSFFIFLFFAFILISVMLSSCSDSGNPVTPPGNGNNGDTLIFSLDSLITFTNLNPASIDTTLFLDTINIRVTFTGETNFDSSKAYSELRVICADTTVNNFVVYGKNSINKDFEFRFISAKAIQFYMRIYNCLDDSFKYILIKNIRVYKTN